MSKERILVVEDEDIVRESLLRVLTRAGYKADGVSSGEAGLSRLTGKRYDLLLVDIKMPRMDGVTFLAEARQRDPEVGAILVTGYGTIEHAVEALELGAQGFVLKPVAPDRLLSVLDGALARLRLWRDIYGRNALVPLLTMTKAVADESDTTKLMATFLDVIAEQTQAECSAILLPDGADAMRFRVAQSRGFLPEFSGLSVEATSQLRQEAERHGEPIPVRAAAEAWPSVVGEWPMGALMTAFVFPSPYVGRYTVRCSWGVHPGARLS